MPPNKLLFLFSFLLSTHFCYSQNASWTEDEKKYYKTAKELCIYLSSNKYDTTKREIIFKNFIYFDYVLKDTSSKRIKNRIEYFDNLFPSIKYFVDSIGLVNLDAKPVRFFKNDIKFYEPFANELKSLDSTTLAFYDKRNATKPLGTLLFEQTTHKLGSWILIDQGGYHYFLTFNLVGNY